MSPATEVNESEAAQTDYGPDNQNLPQSLKEAIITATKEAQRQEKFFRLQEIIQASMDRFYDMGIQHIYQDRAFCWTQAIPGGKFPTGDGGEDSFGSYIGDYNIYTAFGFIIQVKVSEPDIGIDFQPIDPQDPDDRESATAAEGLRQKCDIDEDPHGVAQRLAYFLEMDGRAVLYTYTDDDPAQFGTAADGGPLRKICRDVGGVLEWKVPIFADDRKGFWYAIRYDDPDIKTARTDYPWIADDISAGTTCLEENAYERIARLAVVMSSQNYQYNWNAGDSLSHLISRGRIWLRHSAFERMKEAFRDDDGQVETVDVTDKNGEPIIRAKSIREKMIEVFPQGVESVIVGNQYASSCNKSMDDCISVVHAYIGKGQSRKPIMKEMVLVQDRFNQTVNYIAEKNDFAVPSTWLNTDVCDYDAITKQRARPGSFRALKDIPQGMTIEQCVYREEESGIPKDFMSFAEFLMSALPQFQLSVPPSVWGAATSDTKVAELYQMSASQAMGILGNLRNRIVCAMAESYYQACIAVSRDEHYGDKILIPVLGGSGQTKTLLRASLSKGNFRCYPDKDSGFPESTSQRRQSMTQVLEMTQNTPAAMQLWSSPRNVAEVVREYGLDLEIPEAESWSKQSREGEILLRNPPRLKDPALVQLLATGAGVQAMVDAIKAAHAAAQQQAQQQLVAGLQTKFEDEYAAQVLAAQAQGLPTPPKPAMPPMPDAPPVPLSVVAQSSVPVRDSDYHVAEANASQNWLNSTECWNEETLGRAVGDGPPKPNIAGVLNWTLHWMEHLEKAPTQPPPQAGPLPPKGSPPKQLPPPAGGM